MASIYIRFANLSCTGSIILQDGALRQVNDLSFFMTIMVYRKILLNLIISSLLIMQSNCRQSPNKETSSYTSGGIVVQRIDLYSHGEVTISMPLKVWYMDSLVIEEIAKTKTFTYETKPLTLSVTPLWYRLIDLQKRMWFDFATFTDTARMIKKGNLPDKYFADHGWAFYSSKSLEYGGTPEKLHDTMIEGIPYLEYKFTDLRESMPNTYAIGYFRNDKKGNMFSLEKEFSNKMGYTMTKRFDYKDTSEYPYISMQLEFISDTLSQNEIKIFSAWKKKETHSVAN
jgi:hypothetical protein